MDIISTLYICKKILRYLQDSRGERNDSKKVDDHSQVIYSLNKHALVTILCKVCEVLWGLILKHV